MFFTYALICIVGWALVGWFVWTQTRLKSRDRKLRPLAYVCFAVAALAAILGLVYVIYYDLLPILFPDMFRIEIRSLQQS